MLDEHRLAPTLRDRDRHDLVGQQAVLDRRGGTLVAGCRHFVHLGPRNRGAGVAIGAEPHQAGIEGAPQPVTDDRVLELGVAVAEPAARPLRQVRGVGHRLHAAGHDDVGVAGLDHLIGEVDRVQTRQADLVDVDRRHVHRNPGLDGGLAGRHLALPGHQHLAHDDVVDLLGRDTGPFQGLGDGEPAEVGSREGGEGA